MPGDALGVLPRRFQVLGLDGECEGRHARCEGSCAGGGGGGGLGGRGFFGGGGVAVDGAELVPARVPVEYVLLLGGVGGGGESL